MDIELLKLFGKLKNKNNNIIKVKLNKLNGFDGRKKGVDLHKRSCPKKKIPPPQKKQKQKQKTSLSFKTNIKDTIAILHNFTS